MYERAANVPKLSFTNLLPMNWLSRELVTDERSMETELPRTTYQLPPNVALRPASTGASPEE